MKPAKQISLAIFAAAIAACAEPQAPAQIQTTAQAQPSQPPPASAEDVKKEVRHLERNLDKKISDQNAAILRTANDLAEKSKADADATQAALEAAMKKLDDQRRADAAERAKMQIHLREEISGGLLLAVAFGAFLVLRTRTGRNTNAGAQPKVVPIRPEFPDRLLNPIISDLQAWANAANKAGYKFKLIPMCLTFDEGNRLDCDARLRENAEPLVYFPGCEKPISWVNRYPKGANLLGISPHKQGAKKPMAV